MNKDNPSYEGYSEGFFNNDHLLIYLKEKEIIKEKNRDIDSRWWKEDKKVEEFTIKVSTKTNDYYNVRAESLEDAYAQVIDLILNSDDRNITDSLSYITSISCVEYDEDRDDFDEYAEEY